MTPTTCIAPGMMGCMSDSGAEITSALMISCIQVCRRPAGSNINKFKLGVCSSLPLQSYYIEELSLRVYKEFGTNCDNYIPHRVRSNVGQRLIIRCRLARKSCSTARTRQAIISEITGMPGRQLNVANIIAHPGIKVLPTQQRLSITT
jgi:hypothetical protein